MFLKKFTTKSKFFEIKRVRVLETDTLFLMSKLNLDYKRSNGKEQKTAVEKGIGFCQPMQKSRLAVTSKLYACYM